MCVCVCAYTGYWDLWVSGKWWDGMSVSTASQHEWTPLSDNNLVQNGHVYIYEFIGPKKTMIIIVPMNIH